MQSTIKSWLTADFSVLRVALRSALPLFISLSLLSIISLVDIFLAGQISEDAQAAMGIAEQVVFLNMIMLTGLCAGMNAKISQAWGAGNLREVGDFARHGTYVALIFGAVATIFGVLSADVLAGAFTANPSVRHQAADYIRVCACANLWWAAIMCQTTVFRAVGKAHFGTYEWLLITVLCVGLELFCFYGLVGCRSLVSLAVSWNLAAPAGVIFGFVVMRKLFPGRSCAGGRIRSAQKTNRSEAGCEPVPAEALPDVVFLKNARSILAIAVPVMVGEMCWLVSNLVLYVLLAAVPSATTAQASWTITLRIEETLAYVPLTACSLATATMVGHAVGRGGEQHARRMAQCIAIAASSLMLIVGITVWLSAPYIAPCFSDDTAVQRLTIKLLSGSICMFPANAVAMILSSALEGRGMTIRPMFANVTGMFAVRLPCAWALSLPMGVIGVWWGKLISNFVAAALMIFVFSNDNWKLSAAVARVAHAMRRLTAPAALEDSGALRR